MLLVGDVAPNFILSDQSSATIELARLKGKKVVLYFYPKDMTPGCTLEACNFRDAWSELRAQNVEILGVSRDSVSRHKTFSKTFNLPFPLLADTDGAVAQAYGALREKKFLGRTYMGIERMTYLIDSAGIIAAVWPDVKVVGHLDEVLAAAKALG